MTIKWRGLAGQLFLALFLLTALLGVWAAYNRAAAWGRFTLLALGIALALIAAATGPRHNETLFAGITIVSACLAAAAGLYFVQAHDWANPGGEKFAGLRILGLWLQSHAPAPLIHDDIHPNVAGSILAVTIPLGAGGLLWAYARPHRLLALFLAAVLSFAAFCLLLTASRGAWLGLLFAVLIAGFAAWRARKPLSSTWPIDAFLLLTAVLLGVVFWAAVAIPGAGRLLGSAGAVSGAAVSRGDLWRDMLVLAGDYPITGSGLGGTATIYSTYIALVHVDFVTHAHNIFLQTSIEQGIFGLLALLGMIGWSVRSLLIALWLAPREAETRRLDVFYLAALAALVALTVHGMVEAGLYVGKGAPVLFAPVAIALAATPSLAPANARSIPSPKLVALVAGLAGLVLLLAAGWLLPSGRALLLANLGTVAQTRAELSVYHWPEWPIQDALRRSPQVDLDPAIAYYKAALALNPTQATANRRLGQIALSRGEYQQAENELRAAFAAAPEQRPTRQLLGEAYAIRGDIGAASSLWAGLDLGQDQIAIRRWWYDHLGDSQRAQWIDAASQAVRLGSVQPGSK